MGLTASRVTESPALHSLASLTGTQSCHVPAAHAKRRRRLRPVSDPPQPTGRLTVSDPPPLPPPRLAPPRSRVARAREAGRAPHAPPRRRGRNCDRNCDAAGGPYRRRRPGRAIRGLEVPVGEGARLVPGVRLDHVPVALRARGAPSAPQALSCGGGAVALHHHAPTHHSRRTQLLTGGERGRWPPRGATTALHHRGRGRPRRTCGPLCSPQAGPMASEGREAGWS